MNFLPSRCTPTTLELTFAGDRRLNFALAHVTGHQADIFRQTPRRARATGERADILFAGARANLPLVTAARTLFHSLASLG